MSKVVTEVNLGKVERKLSQSNADKAQYMLANQMLADMNQYVPYRENPLRTSGALSPDNKVAYWNTPYARAQFYGSNGIVAFRQYTTPGTGRRWDLMAKANHMDSWERVWLKGGGF